MACNWNYWAGQAASIFIYCCQIPWVFFCHHNFRKHWLRTNKKRHPFSNCWFFQKCHSENHLPLAKKTFVRSFFFSSSSFRTMFTSYIGTHSFHRSMLNRVTNRHTKRLRSKTHLKCAGKHMIGALEVDISPKILVSNVWSLGLWGSFRSYLLLFLKFFQRSRESLFIFLHFGAILSRSFIIFRLHTMSCWL